MSHSSSKGGFLWRGLSLQLLLLFLLPVTLLLLAVAVGGSLLHQTAMRDLVGERDERSTRAAAAVISEQLEQRAKAVSMLAERAAQMAEPEQALVDLAPFLPEFSGGLAFSGADGQLLAAQPPDQEWHQSLAERLGQQSEPGQPSFFLVPLSTAGAVEESALVVAATANGLTAAGAFSPFELARRALSPVFHGGEAASAFVVTSTGELIYHSGAMPLNIELLDHPGVVSALRGESGTTTFSDEHGEHIVAFSPITPVGWAMVIEEPWHAVAGLLLRTTEWAPLVLAPVLIITLLGLTFGARQIVRPLQSLAGKATSLAWGDFDAIEEPVGGIVEIQHLQRELVHMAQKVRHAQQNLRDYLGAVTAGQEDERRRLARELHDDTIQALMALNQRIQLAQMAGPEAAQLAEMQEMVAGLIADLRRTIHALRPIYLEDLGLVPALHVLTQEMADSAGLAITFASTGEPRRLNRAVELALYRIAQEALNNVVRHAAARHARVTLGFQAGAVRLAVGDDGRGFVVPESPAGLAPQAHFGLLGIHERAELIGARLRLASVPGKGTQVEVEVDV